MTMYFLPLQRRLIALFFPLLILLFAGLAIPIFVQAGLPWWPLFIFGPPGLLAVLICVEYFNVAIGFDAEGVRYRGVGYEVIATWHNLSERRTDGRISLHVKACEPHYHWWLGVIQALLVPFMPGRSRYAHGLMATIPLYWFSTAPDDAVMTAFRRLSSGRVAADFGMLPRKIS